MDYKLVRGCYVYTRPYGLSYVYTRPYGLFTGLSIYIMLTSKPVNSYIEQQTWRKTKFMLSVLFTLISGIT